MKFLSAIGLVCLLFGSALGQRLTPTDLTTEYRANPLGIGEAIPRLAWLLKSPDENVRGQRQTAYEIRVASTQAILASGHGDLWDSGKVLSRATSQIEYGGLPLVSGEQCWWQARVWNGGNEVGSWSMPATWSVGLQGRADWKAEWIGMDSSAEIPPMQLVGCQWIWTDENIRMIMPRTRYFRGRFVLPAGRKMRGAVLGVTASDRFEAWVNGHHVLDGKDRQTLFCREVEFCLHPGENVIAIKAENDGNYPAMAGRLEIRFEKGAPMDANVDSQWKSTATELAGWQKPGFEDATWKKVQTLGPVGRQPWGQPTQVHLPLDPAVYLRREFLLEKKVARATFYATALGDYELHINGECVSPDQLVPGVSDYRRRVYFQTYDVTKQIHLGHNALGIILADGLYAGYWPSTHRSHNYGGDPRVFGQLEIDFTDGTTVCIATDDKWRMSLGPIRQADRTNGTVYDDREDLGAWDQGLYRRHGMDWVVPKVGLNGPEPILSADYGAPLRDQEVIAAKDITEGMPDVYRVDFGQAVAGHIRLHGYAQTGQLVEIQYMDGVPGDHARRGSRGEMATDADTYVAGDNGEFTFEPKLTLRHFRYVVISGLGKIPNAAEIEAVAVYPDVERTGWFTSSDPALNMRAEKALWAERNHGADWPSDRFLAAASGAYDDNLAPMYYRLLDSIRDQAHISKGGVITSSSPLDHEPLARDSAQDAEPIVLWELLRMYGDQRVVRRHFAELADYMNDLREHWMDYAHQDRFFADGPNGNTEDAEMVALAYAAHVADMMSQMSAQIGNQADAQDYRRMFDDLSGQFQERYLNIGSSRGIHTQTGYAVALQWNLTPNQSRKNAAEQLQKRIGDDHDKIAMGDLGRSQLLFALSDSGHADSAYALLNHRNFNDVWAARWLYEDAAGISPLAFGFQHILIRPRLSDKLGSSGAIYDSNVGRIVCKWNRDDQGTHLQVRVPINCTAELMLNDENGVGAIQESGAAASEAPGIKLIRNKQGGKIFELQSGNYAFSAMR